VEITIEYNGEYPNLCSGNLVVVIDGIRWNFPDYCLSSGGSVSFDEEWNEEVTRGKWSISEWPEGFPKSMKKAVEKEVNNNVRHGCCGGCV
jgi:hypothetical protein